MTAHHKTDTPQPRRYTELPAALHGASVATSSPPPSERLLRMPQVEDRVGAKKTAIYAWVKAGTFPPPIKIGPMALWLESEVEAWIHKQVASYRGTG